MEPRDSECASLRRIAAGKLTRSRRGPLSEEGRERLRQAAFRHQPWTQATGPKTPAGKAQAARNGKKRQLGPRSVREIRADLSEIRASLKDMAEIRRQIEIEK